MDNSVSWISLRNIILNNLYKIFNKGNADIENLIVSEARVDDAGIRIGTKRWIAKDRGRAHPIHKKACHVYVTVTEV